ncbi:MAG: hypothetical protein Q9168_004196 [Polycauliona sp. 1 TL-2023]
MQNLTSTFEHVSEPETNGLSLDGRVLKSCLLLLLTYPLLVAYLRYDRLRSNRKHYGYTTRRSFARMTDDEAAEIQITTAQLEFPFTFHIALQFALFRTYGIPSISKLLVATSQFSELLTATKRYTDTEVLIREFTSHKPSDPRSLEAIARVNYIHSAYLKNGSIRADDMLYTLSLFALEPIRWIERYEWRSLEAFERCAQGTFWKSLGDAMGISYQNLKSAGEGWEDALQWLDELAEWSEQYERENMVPNANNHRTAEQTVEILLWGIPSVLKPFGSNLVSVLMDDRLRAAMIYPTPPDIYFHLVSFVFTVRKYVLRYLFLPRPYVLRVNALEEMNLDGRRSVSIWDAAPYYVKPTTWRRWGPGALLSRISGLPVPGDDGAKYYPEGYKFPEVGPSIFRGKGEEAAKETVHGLAKTRTGGCPFGRVKAE